MKTHCRLPIANSLAGSRQSDLTRAGSAITRDLLCVGQVKIGNWQSAIANPNEST